jgi:hypothetical protein
MFLSPQALRKVIENAELFLGQDIEPARVGSFELELAR